MKVSIVIPVYNVALYVEDCLKSVLAQTYDDLEVVIVNDCTPDGSMELVRRVLGDSKIKREVQILEHDCNKGLSAARNTGLAHCTGEYVFFLDSDDEITPDCIEILVKEGVGSRRPDMVVGDYVVRNSTDFFPPLKMPTTFLQDKEDIVRTYMEEKVYVMAWNKLVRKDFITGNGLFFREGLIHEDCLWSFQCTCAASSVAIVKHPTYIYKVRANSIKSSTKQAKDVHALKEVLSGMVQYAAYCTLEHNRHVFSFIEEEKLRLLYACRNYGYDRISFAREVYDWFSSLPGPGLIRIFLWDVLKTRYCVRDAHYFLPAALRVAYYWSLPEYLAHRSRHGYKFRFYFWFFSSLIRRAFFPSSVTLPEAATE
ncbi:MAG: glycosyltransferase [Paraprevotella sp.]|nr:glycosyltransferase [Paraprevotella sp.]